MNVKTLIFVLELAVTILGLAMAVASVGGLVPDLAGVAGWLISTIALMRLLATRRRRIGDHADGPRPYSMAARMLLASVAVLCISIVVILLVVLGPQVPPQLDPAAKIVFSLLVLLSALTTAICIFMTRH